MFTSEIIEEYFNALETKLLEGVRVKFKANRKWAGLINFKSGVYLVFKKGKPYYIGESADIGARMKDLTDTRNHTLRRKIGARYFNNQIGFEKANSSRKFNDIIEQQVNNWMEENLEVAFMEVNLGRREFEEWMIIKHSLEQKSKRE